MQTDYSFIPSPFDPLLGNYGTQLANVVPIRTTTTLDDGQQTKVERDYDPASFVFKDPDPTGLAETFDGTFGLVLQTREHAYGSGAPGALVRRTDASYLALTNSNYKTWNQLDLVTAQTTRNAAGTRIAESIFAYDEAIPEASGVTTHHNLSPPNGNIRGNQTSADRWLDTTGTYLPTARVFLDTGMVKTETDPGVHTTTYEYNTASTMYGAFPTKMTTQVGLITNFIYATYTGELTKITDPSGVYTIFNHDDMQRLEYVTQRHGGRVDFTYTDTIPAGVSLTTKIRATPLLNKLESATVDGLGRAVQTRLDSDPDCPTPVKVDITYDKLGRRKTVTNPYCTQQDLTFGTTTYDYDALDRVITVTQPDGSQVTTLYAGNTVTVTDEAGKQRKSETDALGRLTRVWEPDGAGALVNETAYQYDLLDNLTRVEQKGNGESSENWRTRTFVYDSLSRLTSASNPESGATSYTYDSDSSLLTKTGARGITITYGYDADHRLLSKDYSDTPASPDVSYLYDTNSGCPVALTTTFGQGRRTCMSDAAGVSAWSYDDGGRVKIERRKTGTLTRTFSFTYHLDNAIKTVVYQGGRTVTYEPSSAGRLLSAIDSGIGVTYAGGAQYAPQGALEYATHGAAGLNRALVYNNRLQPSLVTVGTPGQTVMDLAYNFDADPGPGVVNNGNVIDITNNLDGGRSQSFGYDNLNRLETAKTQATTGDRCFGETFGYDKWANLLSIGRITPAYDACSQEFLLVGVDGKNQINNQGYGYDNAGNMTDDTSHEYTYDAENRLTTVDGGTTATYSYDGDGQRVQKSSGTLYWYGPGGEVLQETDAAGTLLRDFIYFNGQRVARREANNTVYFFFSDHLGSARMVTDASGSVVEESDFYPYGREIVITDLLQGSQDNPYKFTGQERDPETNLDYFGARHYSYSLGRFLTPDWSVSPAPVPYADFSNPQSLNLYSYVGNNPLTNTDLGGHCWPASDCASAIDSFVQTFRQDGVEANDRSSSVALAAVNTFANGVVADLASGAVDMLRLGEGTSAAIDSASQGDYLAAAAALSQDGGRVGQVILAVTAVAARVSPSVNAQEVAQKVGGNSVETPAGRVDLQGSAHFNRATGQDISTPHVHETATNTNPRTGQTFTFQQRVPRPATNADVSAAAKAAGVNITPKPPPVKPPPQREGQ